MKSDGKKYLQMIEEINQIASNYALSKQTLFLNTSTIKSESVDVFNPYYRFIDRVNKAFLKLENLYKEIIINEFFSPNDAYWWQLYYSQNTFVKFKEKAMKTFLGYFNEVD